MDNKISSYENTYMKFLKEKVIAPCAPVQALCEASHELVDSNCIDVKESKVEVKTECNEICLEEAMIPSTCNFEEVHVKKEEEDEAMPVAFTNDESNSFSENVKIECLGDPLHEHSCDSLIYNEDVEADMREKDFHHASGSKMHEITEDKFNVGTNLECQMKIHSPSKKEAYKWNLKLHNRKRTREKLFKCVMCNNQFAKEADLKLHFLIHKAAYKLKEDRSPPPEEYYKCIVCNKEFLHPWSLKTHVRLHTGEKPFKCDRCDRKFITKASLRCHMETHSGPREKPYKCDVCYKAYCTLTKLKEHYVTHTGEKSYKCHICHKGFHRMSGLNQHHRVHSGVKPSISNS